MTTHDQHIPAAPRQGDNVLDPAIAQGDWTAESQEPPREADRLQPEQVAQPAADPVADPTTERLADTNTTVADTTTTDSALIPQDQLTGLRARWDSVQAGFVDDPRECVQKADGLVTDVVDQLTTSFAHTRSGLEEQWSRGESASTEDLRVALTRYRDFFERLLAV